jgi:tryptophan-rich sensory protein
MKESTSYIIAFTTVLFTSLFGQYFTYGSTKSPWFACIKPELTPPSFLFPLAWTILYVLLAIAFARVLSEENSGENSGENTGDTWFGWDKHKIQTIGFFLITFVLNVLWCYLYFGKQQILQALMVLFLMVWVGVMMLANAWQKSDLVSVSLLTPYVLWILFATLLNFLSLRNSMNCSSQPTGEVISI